MANISVYDPFGTRFSKLFNNLLWHPALLNDSDTLECKLDVAEDADKYTVKADLPGVSKDNIKVDIDGNRVAISAEVKHSEEKKEKENVVFSERYEGKVFRSFTLDYTIDEAKATAKYADGVLELVLPKKLESGGKRITIA